MGSSEENPFSSDGVGLHDGPCTNGNGGFIDSLPVHVKEFMAGGAAGAFARTAVAPLDRIKLLLQIRSKEYQSTGVYPSLKKLLKHEAVQGSYKGIGDSTLRIVPYAAVYFMAFDRYRYWLLSNSNSYGRAPVMDLLAGAAAGGTAVLCTYPLDLAREKLVYQMEDGSQSFRTGMGGLRYQPALYGMQDILKSVFEEGGVRALYRGVGPTLLEVLPSAGIKFYAYEELKRQVPEEKQDSITIRLSCGAVAGLLGHTFMYPLDVVKRQMQVETSPEGGARYRNTIEGLVAVTSNQGWRQLLAGLSSNYIRVVPSWAIGLTAYDIMKSWLCTSSEQKP